MGFTTPLPASAEEWEAGRPALRRKLRRLLGEWPKMFTPRPEVIWRRDRRGFAIEKIVFDNGAGDSVYGLVLAPREPAGCAVLFHHQHAKRYAVGKREVISRCEDLVQRGVVVLAIDAYGFEDRRTADEETLFKRFLWEGCTYWGMIVRDDLLALRYLLSRPDVDAKRVAAMGMSMGSTRSWWAAALDDRIARVVSVACLTRYQDLLEAGELRQHGVYYFVPGMLRAKIDMEQVIGLIAPRPHLTLTGDSDAGSPVSGVRTINRFQQRLYTLYGTRRNFRGLIYPGVGHEWTPEMWKETLAWLEDL